MRLVFVFIIVCELMMVSRVTKSVDFVIFHPTGRYRLDQSISNWNGEMWTVLYFSPCCHFGRDKRSPDTVPVRNGIVIVSSNRTAKRDVLQFIDVGVWNFEPTCDDFISPTGLGRPENQRRFYAIQFHKDKKKAKVHRMFCSLHFTWWWWW